MTTTFKSIGVAACQQFTRSVTISLTSSASSEQPTTTSVNSIKQLPQGAYIPLRKYVKYLCLLIDCFMLRNSVTSFNYIFMYKLPNIIKLQYGTLRTYSIIEIT